MDEGLIFYSCFLLSKEVVLPNPRLRRSSNLLKEERSKKEKSVHAGKRDFAKLGQLAVPRRWYTQYLEDDVV